MVSECHQTHFQTQYDFGEASWYDFCDSWCIVTHPDSELTGRKQTVWWLENKQNM